MSGRRTDGELPAFRLARGEGGRLDVELLCSVPECRALIRTLADDEEVDVDRPHWCDRHALDWEQAGEDARALLEALGDV